MLIIKVNITQWIESLFLGVCPSHHEVSLCINPLYVNSWQICIFAVLVFPMKLVFNTGFFSPHGPGLLGSGRHQSYVVATLGRLKIPDSRSIRPL